MEVVARSSQHPRGPAGLADAHGMLMEWQRRRKRQVMGLEPTSEGRRTGQADHHTGKNRRKGFVLCAGKSAENLGGTVR